MKKEQRECMARVITRAVAEGDWLLVEAMSGIMAGVSVAPLPLQHRVPSLAALAGIMTGVSIAPLVPGISPPRVRKPRAAVVVPPPPPVPPPPVRSDDADMGTPAWPPGDLDWQASPSGHYHGFWRSGDRAGKLAAVVPVLPPGAVLVQEEEEETK